MNPTLQGQKGGKMGKTKERKKLVAVILVNILLSVSFLVAFASPTGVYGEVNENVSTFIHSESAIKTIEGELSIHKENVAISSIELSNYRVKGNVIIMLKNSISSGNIWVNVTNMWVEGGIIVVVEGNQIAGDIHIDISSNPIVYGNISLTCRDNKCDPGGIYITIGNNGENAIDSSKNQAVGRILAGVYGNWCYPLAIGVSDNWVHYSIELDISSLNQVNTCSIGVIGNHIGELLTLKFIGNDVDRVLTVTVEENNIGDQMSVDISNNVHLGWIEYKCPCTVDIFVRDNHCVEKNRWNPISADGNNQYGPTFNTEFSNNGFGGDVDFSVSGNTNKLPGAIMANQFSENKCDQEMSITVQGNGGYTIKDSAVDNTASDAVPVVSLQGPVNVKGNIQQNPQTVGGDSDGDGLTDEYEKMIGTDKNKKDTDNDGLSDGWDDTNGNKAFDTGEKFGEIGDPLQEVDVYRHGGAIATLYENNAEIPNPINKDIFVEVDFLQGCTISADTLKKVKDIFAKHCIWLHIDTGWPAGPAGGATGGDVINGGWTHNGRNYLYFYWQGTRRLWILHPPTRRNDFYDFKIGNRDTTPSGYFNGGINGGREDIFHYVLFVNYIATRNTSRPLLVEYEDSTMGISEIGRLANEGDDFLIAYDTHVTNNALNETDLRCSFMHELGHNLELFHSQDSNGSDPDPNVNPDPTRETVRDTVMYWSGGTKLDYLRAEWARINLAAVCDGTHTWYS